MIQVSTHVQVDQSESECHDVCISLYITHVMIVHYGFLTNQEMGNQRTISTESVEYVILKMVEQNDSCIVMSFIL